MRLPYRLMFVLLILLASTACNRPGPDPSPTVALPVDESPITPGSQTSPLSEPIVPVVSTPPTPSSNEVGTVYGVLFSADRPAQSVILCLGQIVTDASGKPLMAGLDRTTAPCTQTDAEGRFVFADVPAGEYPLFLDLITNAVALNDPVQGQDLLIEVKGGSLTKLGTLKFGELPSIP